MYVGGGRHVCNVNASLAHTHTQVIHRCEDLFDGECWWRNKYMNCCDLFTIQRSEYGICYAFNSATSPRGQRLVVSVPPQHS